MSVKDRDAPNARLRGTVRTEQRRARSGARTPRTDEEEPRPGAREGQGTLLSEKRGAARRAVCTTLSFRADTRACLRMVAERNADTVKQQLTERATYEAGGAGRRRMCLM